MQNQKATISVETASLAANLATNGDFIAMAMQDAFELLSKKSGISVKALQKQFPKNKELQTRVAEMVAFAAMHTAKNLNK